MIYQIAYANVITCCQSAHLQNFAEGDLLRSDSRQTSGRSGVTRLRNKICSRSAGMCG